MPQSPRNPHHPLVLAVLLLALALAPVAALAQQEAGGDPIAQAMVSDFDGAAKKLVQLAEAIPADKYTWRPAEGVFSVSEALMHVVEANFGLSRALGVEPPGDLPEDPASITDKAKVVEMLKASLDQARKALEQAGAGDLGAMRPAFGREVPTATLAFLVMGHNHEHLGQLIAYARSNGVVPPWSRG